MLKLKLILESKRNYKIFEKFFFFFLYQLKSQSFYIHRKEYLDDSNIIENINCLLYFKRSSIKEGLYSELGLPTLVKKTIFNNTLNQD